MPDVPISQLPPVSSVAQNAYTVVDQDGLTRRAAISQIVEGVAEGITPESIGAATQAEADDLQNNKLDKTGDASTLFIGAETLPDLFNGKLDVDGDGEAVTIDGNSLGDIIPATVRVVDTMDDLRALSAAQSAARPTVQVRGYYAAGDGGGGWFFWDGASTATDNGGTVIALDGVTTGRWKRIVSGPLDVRWFGAVGDGSTINTTTLQNALSSAEGTGRDVYIPAGTYLSGKLLWGQYVGLIGDGGGKSVLKLASGTNDHLLVSRTWEENRSYVDLGNRMRGLDLDGNKANNTSGDCLVLRSYAAIIEDVEVHSAAGNGIRHTAVTKNGGNGLNAAECFYKACRVRDNNGRGMWFYDNGTNKVADAYIVECLIHNNGSGGYYQIDSERSAGFHVLDNQIYSSYEGDIYLGGLARTVFSGNHCDLHALNASGSNSYSSLALGAGIDGGVIINNNFFYLGQTEVATCTYNLINFQSSGVPVNLVGNSFRVTGTYTNKRAINRSAASAAVGDLSGNYFSGFSAAELGQGYSDLAPEFVGLTANVTGLGTVSRAVGGSTYTSSSQALCRFSSDQTGPFDIMHKSRSATVGGNAALLANDILGTRTFHGNTGSGSSEGAHIRAVTDGNWSTSSTPARIVLASCPVGSAAVVDYVELKSDGTLRPVTNNLFPLGDSSHRWASAYTVALDVSGAASFGGNVGFYGATPQAKPTVTGSRGGNAALASLLTSLAALGLITDSTSA